MRSASTTPTNSPLARDIQNVVTDAQELLKTVQTEGESRLADVKQRVQTQVDTARARLGELQDTVQDGAKLAAQSTDAYVHSNPWTAVGIGAAVGLVIGYLAARR